MGWRFGLMAVAVLGSTAAVGQAAGRASDVVRLVSVRSDAGPHRYALVLEASAPVAYTMRQPDPLTVLVGLRNVEAFALSPTTAISDSPVSRVDIGREVAFDGVPMTMVRLALRAPAEAKVRSDRNAIRVEFPDAAPAAEAGRTSAAIPRATRLIAVSAATASGRTTITLRGNGLLVPRAVEEARDLPHRLIVDLPDVASSVPSVTPVGSDTVNRVRVSANSVTPLVTRVVIDLTGRVPYAVEQGADEIVVVLGDAEGRSLLPMTSAPQAFEPAVVAMPTAESADLAMRPARPPTTAIEAKPAVVAEWPVELAAPVAAYMPVFAASALEARDLLPPPAPVAAALAPQAQPARSGSAREPVPARAEAAALQTTPAAPIRPPVLLPDGPDRQFTGHAVTLDFQGVDLRAVLRTFSEITGLNIVIDPSVQGTVDVNLRDVPWDQALDIILRANQLGYVVEGNIVRIAPLSKLREEQEERRKLADARALSGDLETISRTLSYAKAEDMTQLLTRAALTSRGSIQVDKRTNTLIIRDLPGGLEAAGQLIETLDRAQPQVEIEARIVQTNRNYLRELGFRWGLGLEASQRMGNALPFSFPNQVSGVGGTDVSTLNPAKSVIGLVTSSVNGAFNLDLELQAAEQAGKIRILSTPRVSTQNNVEAEISQGTQIPVQTIANNTVTVTFKDATLTLRVRPQITSSNTVIMNVSVENGSPDYTRAVNGIPPIDTQRANTQVQVSDGATTVIGGIFVSSERQTEDRTPALHRLPLLGWLFKSDNRSDTSQELLIFLTPRISR